MATLEDLERRVIALERAAERDRSVERAAAEIVAESERRTAGEIKRLDARIAASENRIVDVINEGFFDAVMAAFDRLGPDAALPAPLQACPPAGFLVAGSGITERTR